MRLAYVVANLGAPPGDGLQEQTLLMIDELVRAGVDIDVFAMARRLDSVDLGYVKQRCGVSLREPLLLTSLPGVVNALLGHLPQMLLPREIRRLRRSIEGGDYDSYHFDGLGSTVLLSRKMRPAVIGIIDPGSVRFRRFMRSGHGIWERARAVVLLLLHEIAEAGLARPGLVWHLVSPVDARTVRFRRSRQALFVAPIMRPVAGDRPRTGDKAGGTTVLIWVDARQPHQARAAASFIDEVVVPSSRAPDLHVRVLARTDSLGRWRRPDAVAVEVITFTDNLAAELAEADVVIVPDEIGTGLKNRLVEAMAAGRPVLASEVSAEGFSFVDRRDLAVYQDLRDARCRFAEMLDSDGLRRRLGEGGRAAVSARHAPSIVCAAVLQQHRLLGVG